MIDFLYDFFYIVPLAVAVILNGLSDLGYVNYSAGGCIFSIILIAFVLLMRYCGKREKFLAGGIIAAACVGLYFVLGADKRHLVFDKYNWLLWVALIDIICIAVGRLSQKIIWIKIIVSMALVGNLVYLLVIKREISDFTCPMVFLVLLIYLLEIVQIYWKKSGYSYTKNHVAFLSPILLGLCILVSLIPSPQDPFDWSAAKNLWKMTVTGYKRIVGLIKAGEDEYGYTGFYDRNVFTGNLSPSDKEVMVIIPGESYFDNLYVDGISFDSFDGKKWTNELEQINDSRIFDLMESRHAIQCIEDSYEREFIKEDRIAIENRLYNTKYLFVPLKSNILSRNTFLPEYTESEEQLLADSRLKYGDTYQITYFTLNFGNPDLPRLIDYAIPIEREEWSDTLHHVGIPDESHYSFDNYKKYCESVYTRYSSKEGLSPQVSELLDEITAPYDGDYEKLMAIATYLQGFEYNRQPGVLPASVHGSSDYLDYFLLESQKGYCVHFATAFTLLARECGYPARYVQGYYIKNKNRNPEIHVMGNSAHAWSEVYFDNFGWVVFEATPGFSLSKGWAVQSKVSGDLQDYYNRYYSERNEISDVDEATEIAEEKKPFDFKIILIPLLCTIVFGFIYLCVFRLISIQRYKIMNTEQKIQYMISADLRLLRKIGYSLKEYDTLEEFSRLIKHDLEFRTDIDTKEQKELADSLGFLRVYEAFLYSDYIANEKDLDLLEQANQIIKGILKKKPLYRLFLW